MKTRVERFSLDEFRCPCCGEVKISCAEALLLDALRAILATPLVITSGYRCPKHNKEVGGVSRSRHLTGCAADVARPGSVPFDRFFEAAARVFVPAGGKCLAYPERDFLHLAVPRRMERWAWDGGVIEIPPRGF